MSLSQPLVPDSCDLTDFAFMPLDVRRLLNSETWILGSDSERSASMCLWLESWHQVPAGSVPNNDKMLAHLSKAGTKWKKVKDHVLRGWIDGGNGRLYHPVVSEKALEAWIEKLSAAISGAGGNEKRWEIKIDVTELKANMVDAIDRLKTIAPRSKTLKKKIVKVVEAASPPDTPPHTKDISPPDSDKDRNRQGEGEGDRHREYIPPLRDDDSKSVDNFTDLPEYTPPVDDGRRLAWVDMGISEIPDAWKDAVLQDWKDLHADDLKSKWIGFKAHFLDKSGDLKTRHAWQERWKSWIASDAPQLIAERARRDSYQSRTGGKSENPTTRISRAEIESKAWVGESYEQAEARLLSEKRNKERVV